MSYPFLGVERAGFAVLKSIDVPSILVETAFLSNPDEEKLLSTNEFLESMAKSIYEATLKYLGISSSVVSLRSPSGYKYHVVKDGETLWSISAQEIKKINADIPQSEVVFVGQTLIIP